MGDISQRWNEVGEGFADLGRQLKTHFEDGAEANRAEVRGAMQGLTNTAEHLAEAVRGGAHDPAFREGAQRAAKSLTNALADTFAQVSEELRRAFDRNGPSSG